MDSTQQKVNQRRGRYSRGYLPHYDGDIVTQFVTFRLADSLPESVGRGLQRNLECRLISDIEYHKAIEKYLDRGEGAAHLKHIRIANCVAETLSKFDAIKYELLAWVIMPNHGHILLTPIAPYSLAEIMHSIKSYTANFGNKVLGRSGRFWSPEYFDRFIRGTVHFNRVRHYIQN